MPEPVSPHPLLGRGIEALNTSQWPYAIECFTQVLADVPDSVDARRYLRQALRKQAAAASSNPLTAAWHVLQAWPHVIQGQLADSRKDWTAAAAAYDQALRQAPQHSAWLYQLGQALLKQGQEAAALDALEEATELNPRLLAATRQLADIYLKRGDDQRARTCFERILKVVPHDIQAERGLKNLDAMGTIRKGFGDQPRT